MIIAEVGGAAHVAFVMAAKSWLPVIGVRISAAIAVMDSLFATVQTPIVILEATDRDTELSRYRVDDAGKTSPYDLHQRIASEA